MPRRKDTKGKSNTPTKKVQMQEILKCGTDASYFINNYIKIPHPIKGMIPFNTFPFQDECLEAFQKNKNVIVNKSRQLGLSTIVAAYALWMALFQKEKNILVIAIKLDTAKLFIKKVEAMLLALPEWLVMPKIKAQSVKYLVFSNGSKIQAIPTSPGAGRGEALSLLIVDEAAHVEGIDEIWLGLQPTLSTGGSSILISTPSGVGTLFHKIWAAAKEERNDFVAIELPWTVHPERDQEWFEEQRRAIIEAQGERGVAQELLCSFAASGDTFLRNDVMEKIYVNIKEPIAYWGPEDMVKKDLWIWTHPKTGHKYLIGADVARGDGEDFSAFHVIDIDADEVVAEYKGKVAPDKLAEMLVTVARRYNMAMICPEKNSVGVGCCLKLKEMNYPNLYFDKLHKNIYMVYTAMDTVNELPGFETGQKNRVEILARLEDVLRNRRLMTYSKRLYEELQTFVWKGNKPMAQKGYNDDLIMALAIANSLYEANGTSTYSDDEMAKAMIAGMSVRQNSMNSSQGNQPLPPVMTDGSLSSFLENAKKAKSLQNAKTQNYNDPLWNQFSWVWKD